MTSLWQGVCQPSIEQPQGLRRKAFGDSRSANCRVANTTKHAGFATEMRSQVALAPIFCDRRESQWDKRHSIRPNAMTETGHLRRWRDVGLAPERSALRQDQGGL
jgi:hypothetical protein